MAICQARIAGPAIFARSVSGVTIAMRRRIPKIPSIPKVARRRATSSASAGSAANASRNSDRSS